MDFDLVIRGGTIMDGTGRPGVRGDVETALADLKKVSENGTAAEIKDATEKLQQASYKMAETLYKSTGASTDGTSAKRSVNMAASSSSISTEVSRATDWLSTSVVAP